MEGRIITCGQSAFQMRVCLQSDLLVLLGMTELLCVCDRESLGKSLHASQCRAQSSPNLEFLSSLVCSVLLRNLVQQSHMLIFI